LKKGCTLTQDNYSIIYGLGRLRIDTIMLTSHDLAICVPTKGK